MSIFGFYFVTQLLREMGWPRKQSIFKGESYDTFVADAVIAQSVDWGAALGAGRPRLSLQMIAEMFRDRWDTDDPPNVKMFIEKSAAQDTWSSAASPRDAVQPPQLTAHFGKIDSAGTVSGPKSASRHGAVGARSIALGIVEPRSLCSLV